jgi:hypothetical protein
LVRQGYYTEKEKPPIEIGGQGELHRTSILYSICLTLNWGIIDIETNRDGGFMSYSELFIEYWNLTVIQEEILWEDSQELDYYSSLES